MLARLLARSPPIHSGYDSWRRHPSHADADLHDICSGLLSVSSLLLLSKDYDDESGAEDAGGLLAIIAISFETSVSETCYQREASIPKLSKMIIPTSTHTRQPSSSAYSPALDFLLPSFGASPRCPLISQQVAFQMQPS